ncbi:Quercetin 2,3-dioxygenase [Stieleria maiorica]|uniref:Quercetin 2,3-dioxygenase n=1 Tax=Stieleria maiorica TaxID=2795974 RepID=A0A5B9MH74_9BACT|nr:pirin family protein [Stieleria maiorica]QEG00623.1 Quercetin 2,3-dioxygenase [Stieleria maiorica]
MTNPTTNVRQPKRITTSRPLVEGAGVHLHRGFGFGETEPFDPFLLFDDFRNEDPERYVNGFPWHPHRGIETITYVLAGTVDHADSLGNSGQLATGDIQWMTAGSGIMHQEMPHGDAEGRMHGFQLWANLPAKHKMTKPRYQDISAKDVPVVVEDDGTSVRVLCGDFWGKRGPVEGVAADPRYLDISLPPNTTRSIPIETTRHAFAYVFAGSVRFKDASDPRDVRVEDPMNHGQSLAEFAGNRSLVLFDQGDSIRVQSGEEGGRFLLVSGEPIKEPVAWRGPIVMNTQEEIQQAWRELKEGSFIKS